MAQVTVKFNVKSNANKLYIVGSTANLGSWDPKAAVEVKEGTVAKKFDDGAAVEFKVLAAKSYDAVEKGANGEELANHTFVAAKGLVVELEVNNFAK